MMGSFLENFHVEENCNNTQIKVFKVNITHKLVYRRLEDVCVVWNKKSIYTGFTGLQD